MRNRSNPKWRRILLVATLGSALGGCSDAPKAAPPTTPPTPSQKQQAPLSPFTTKEEMGGAILGLDDLGADWTRDEGGVLDQGALKKLADITKQTGDARATKCEDLYDGGKPSNLHSTGSAMVWLTSSYHTVSISLESSPPVHAADQFKRLRALLKKCDRNGPGGAISVEEDDLTYGVIFEQSGSLREGDESLGIQAKRAVTKGTVKGVGAGPGTAVGSSLYIRIGPHIASVTVWDRGSQARGPKEAERLMTLQVEKLRAAVSRDTPPQVP